LSEGKEQQQNNAKEIFKNLMDSSRNGFVFNQQKAQKIYFIGRKFCDVFYVLFVMKTSIQKIMI
jgi:hypothetical protein